MKNKKEIIQELETIKRKIQVIIDELFNDVTRENDE